MTYDAFNLKKDDIDKYMKLINLNQCSACRNEHTCEPLWDGDENIVFMHSDFSIYNKNKSKLELLSNSFHIPITCTYCGNTTLLAPTVVVRILNESEM
jgi:Fe-S-cluster-containing dehydrogenase component